MSRVSEFLERVLFPLVWSSRLAWALAVAPLGHRPLPATDPAAWLAQAASGSSDSGDSGPVPPPAFIMEAQSIPGAEDDEYWNKLVAHYEKPLTRYINSILRRYLHRDEKWGRAPEIANDVLLAVWKNRDKYRPDLGPLENWIFVIAYNTTHTLLRREGGRLVSETSLEDADLKAETCRPDVEFLYDPEARDTLHTKLVRRALRKLWHHQGGHHQVKLLMSYIYNDHDYAAIERDFRYRIRRATLRMQVKRAKEALERELKQMPEWVELMEKRHDKETKRKPDAGE